MCIAACEFVCIAICIENFLDCGKIAGRHHVHDCRTRTRVDVSDVGGDDGRAWAEHRETM